MKHLFFSKRFWLIGVVVLAVSSIGIYLLLPDDAIPEGVELGVVSTGSVREVISETGVVLPTKEVALAFEQSGRITEIPVQVGASVKEGDVLVQLDASQQLSELNIAIARLQAEEIRLSEFQSGADAVSRAVAEASLAAAESTVESARATLASTIAQQDQLVRNAQQTLLSSGLEAFLKDQGSHTGSASYDAPTVSGTYMHTQEGTYDLEVYSSNAPSGASVRITGLETDTQPISVVRPIAIGSRGLFIQFPEDFARRTTWQIPIPNTRSASYQTNLNAYNAVLESRELAITQAENALATAEANLEQSRTQFVQSSGSARAETIAAQEAIVRQMKAGMESARIALEKRALVAPFDGTITALDAQRGELTTPSAPIISLISQDQFEIKVNISESDIAQMDVHDSAVVTFDAYDGAEFTAEVTQISPQAVMLDGVRVFEVTLRFTEHSDLIKAGLSADVDILTAVRDDVLFVPSRAIAETAEGKFVRTLHDGTITHLPVKVGLRGSDGNSEILEGLSAGIEIITFANSATIRELEGN
jgi:HlyD family secretion protein